MCNHACSARKRVSCGFAERSTQRSDAPIPEKCISKLLCNDASSPWSRDACKPPWGQPAVDVEGTGTGNPGSRILGLNQRTRNSRTCNGGKDTDLCPVAAPLTLALVAVSALHNTVGCKRIRMVANSWHSEKSPSTGLQRTVQHPSAKTVTAL